MRRTSETTIHLSVDEVKMLLTRKGGIKGKCPAQDVGIDDFQIMLKGYDIEDPNAWCGFCSEDCYWNGKTFEMDNLWQKFSIWCRNKQERDEIFSRVHSFLKQCKSNNYQSTKNKF